MKNARNQRHTIEEGQVSSSFELGNLGHNRLGGGNGLSSSITNLKSVNNNIIINKDGVKHNQS